MKRTFPTVLLLVVLTGITWLTWWWVGTATAEKLMYSTASILVLYIIFSVFLKELGRRYISGTKTRYAFRKSVSILFLIIVIIVLLRIWIPNPQALLVAYGVIAAGIAVALQDVIKNLAGGIVIFFGRLYQVGNRIEINDTHGDVIDIDLFNTTLLETREWIDADQATGRITTVPNGVVLSKPIQNYSRSHKYLWDELNLVVTSESSWREAMRLMGEIGHKHTEEFIEEADKSLTQLERYYYVEGHVLNPNVYIQPDASGYKLTLRYVVNAWKRRSTFSHIWEDIIETFESRKDIEIAPTTYAVTEYPKVKQRKKAVAKKSVKKSEKQKEQTKRKVAE